MDDTTGGKDKDKNNGKLLTFPGGKKVDTSEIGADGYIVGQGGQVPTADIIDPKELELEIREREEYVKKQELVQAAYRKANTAEVIDLVLIEVSEELAHLKYERRKATRDGKNTANYTVSRIASLRQLSDVLLKRQENMRQERLDLRSPEFKKIIRAWLGFVFESMTKAEVDENVIDLVFKQIEADMLEWEKQASENIG